MSDKLPIPTSLVREKSFKDKLFEIPNIICRSECCNGVNANDCMNNNKTSFAGAMIIIGMIVGAIITFFIMYYINVSKQTDK